MLKNFKNFAFLDTQNIHLAVKELGWELDWKELRRHLKEKYGVVRAYVFMGYIRTNESLYRYFEACGLEIVFKEIVEQGLEVKGNVDMELAVQIMIDYKKFDQAVIVSNDGDFVALIRYLLSKDKLSVILSPNIYKCSSLLKKAAGKKLQTITHSKNKLQKSRTR